MASEGSSIANKRPRQRQQGHRRATEPGDLTDLVNLAFLYWGPDSDSSLETPD